jgi:hypothetical protein
MTDEEFVAMLKKEVHVSVANVYLKHQESMTDEEFVAMLKKEVHVSVANVYLKWGG